MPLGVIKWFDQRKGFGFVTNEQAQDLFVHFTSITPQVRSKLKPGVKVAFEEVAGEKGPKAIDLKLADDPDAESP